MKNIKFTRETSEPNNPPHYNTNNNHNYSSSSSKSFRTKIFAIILIIALLVAGIIIVFNSNLFNNNNNNNDNPTPTISPEATPTPPTVTLSPTITPTSTPTPTSTATPPSATPTPTIAPTPTPSPTPTPPTREELVKYALELINAERTKQGLPSLTLSSVNSAQLHAEEMLKEKYTSLWNMQGYNAHLRYTLAGGRGLLAESIQQHETPNSALTIDLMASIKEIYSEIMSNNTGTYPITKEAMLHPDINKVSIGIAYDKNNLYLVQDYEKDIITWSPINTNNFNQITLQGTIQNPTITLDYIGVLYSPTPTPLTATQLNQKPLDGNDPTTKYIALITPPAPPGYEYDWTIFHPLQGYEATTWTQNNNNNNFQITFNLNNIINNNEKGIYTLVLTTTTGETLTNYSIIVT